MEILRFYDECDLCSYMIDMANHGKSVTAVLNYEEAAELMRNLLEEPDVEVGHLEIGNHDYNGYDKEYYVSIDSDFIIDVCPAMPHYDVKFGYVPVQESDVILYSGDVKYAIVDINNSDTSYQIEFDIDDYNGFPEECIDKCPLCSTQVLQMLAKLFGE